MAWRSERAPQVIAYWLTSPSIARRAASFTSAGAAKSGKPWERFTAPCRWARRVISRITDSVKRPALDEARMLTRGGSRGARSRARHRRGAGGGGGRASGRGRLGGGDGRRGQERHVRGQRPA